MLTEAEVLLERLCRKSGIPLERIPACEVKTPDYQMTLSTCAVLVEVKQLEPNAEDLEMLATLAAGKVAARSVDMGRARLPINEGVKQLRPHAKGKQPAIVVLYDTMGMTGYLDPYSIAFSLYGPEKVHYDVPRSPAADVIYTGMSRGGRSVATRQHNTTLSAVGVLYEYGKEAKAQLDLFHNIHAAMPLDPASCDEAGFRQFHFIQSTREKMPEWVEWKAKV